MSRSGRACPYDALVRSSEELVLPESERQSVTPLHGPLARLDGAREELAKAWLMQLLGRSSLEEISEMPTARFAVELPALISDVLQVAAGPGDPFELSEEARDRATRLVEMRKSRDPAAADLARDVVAIQSVLIEALARDIDEVGAAGFATLATSIAEAVGSLQAAAVESLVEQRSQELETLANTDPLTGLANLRQLHHQLRQALALAKRYQQPFALIVLDVDGLKRVNDGRGHQVGDRVLIQVGLAMRRTVRGVDTAARIGGDEFCVLAPSQSADAARVLADRLAEAIAAETAGLDGDRGLTASIGVVGCPEHGDEAETLLQLADQAMYRAKATGDAVAVATLPDAGERSDALR
ncbi:MAG: GGDEF domain-containing protein [Thermoleophilaceae bacterium]